jgi:uncharacterized protein YkwD
MKKVILAVYVAVAMLITLAPAHADHDRRPHAHLVRKAEQKLVRFTNHARRLRGESPLKASYILRLAAEDHTWTMGRQDRLFHARSHNCSTWGENVGVTGAGAWALHQAFMASPDHRANVLGPYRTVGVGAVRDAHGNLWVTVEFCSGPIHLLGTAR